jgi:outer membrane cobalamin receptor
VFHTDFNYHYVSRFNSDSSGGLSQYAWVNGYGLADFAVGLGRQDRKFDVKLLVKNAFNTDYNYSQTWSSYTPGLPRWFGVGFSGSF